MIIEASLETGLKSLCDALSYVTANSIPVRKFSDNSQMEGIKIMMVHAKPAERVAPNYNYYRCECEIVAATHIPNDANRAIVTALYQAALGLMNGSSFKTSLATASGLTIDGIVPQPGAEAKEGNYQFLAAVAWIYLTKTP